MFFTDCQMWDSGSSGDSLAKAWDDYKVIAPNAKVYVFDLAGYGRLPLNYKRSDVALIGGWSDRVFDIMEAIENGGNAVEAINQLVL